MDTTEPVNLMRSVCICNIFNFLFAASKACLFPFLTLYLRLLGLSATQTGIVIGAKTISAFIFAPLWAMCSAKFRKRRLVLMFSIFMMALTYLGLTLVMNVNHAAVTCPSEESASSGNIKGSLQELIENIKTTKNSSGEITTTLSLHDEHSNLTDLQNITVGSVTGPTKILSAPSTTKGNNELEKLFNYGRKLLVELGLTKSEVDDLDNSELLKVFQEMISKKEFISSVRESLTPEEMEEFFTFLDKASEVLSRHSPNNIDRKKTVKRSLKDTWEKFKTNWKALRTAWKVKITEAEVEGQIFLILLLTLVFGEVFCSPVEKIADDAWFEFLEKIDNLEKYGKQRIFTSLAYIILPFIVAISVDNTKCLFSLKMHPISLHFYLFGAFLGLTFLVAFFYPIAGSEKRKYKTKIAHALNLTCCKCEGLFYIITLLLVGAIYASYNNFLFWLIEDLKGKELTMGMCVSIANLAEIPMLFFSGPLVRKLGNGMAICLSMTILAGRTLFYSYLWTPWAVLPAEITHAFTHTVMWYAVLSNPAFSTNPTVDRGVRSVFSSVYFGVGFSTGSIISGIVYDQYGVNILFRACAVIAIAWCPIFAVMNRCCSRPEVSEIKYTRLLTSEDVNSDSDDDWLEHALKNG